MGEPPDDTIAYPPGKKRTIAFAVRQNGRCEAREYLEKEADESSRRVYERLFGWMSELGVIDNDQKFDPIEEGIYEFKADRFSRILCFQVGRVWYLTHGFRKTSNKTPRKHIERAKSIREEHLSRESS